MVSKTISLLAMALLVPIAMALSLRLGQIPVTWDQVWQAFMHFDASSIEHNVVRTNRLNRTLMAVVVGAALALAGLLTQTLTRNPLASPSILGVNSGALFAIALALSFFTLSSMAAYMWVALCGALAASILLMGLAQLGGRLHPLRLVMAGSALGALFVALTQGLLMLDETTLAGIVYWLGGSLTGRDLASLAWLLPAVALVFLLAWAAHRTLDLLLLHEEMAQSLGQAIWRTRLALFIAIILLAGFSVASAGLIAFVGLVVPHIAKAWVGSEHRWCLPASLLLGALVLLVADILARLLIAPAEVPTGVMTAFVGVPLFLALLLSRGQSWVQD